MAFIKTSTDKFLKAGGVMVEKGTWSLAAVTTGDIIPEAATTTPSSTAFNASIREIEDFTLASDGNNDILFNLRPATFSPASRLRITGTINDTGTYTIEGRPA